MAGVLLQVAVRGLLVDVVLLVVAMALGGIDRNFRRAADAFVAGVAVGTGCTVLVMSVSFWKETTPETATAFRS